MIKITEHPKKRFNISNKFALYQKQLNKQKHGKTDHVFSHVDNEYNIYINKLKQDLEKLQKEYSLLEESSTPEVKLLDELKKEIEYQQSNLDEILKLSDKSMHDETVSIQNVKYMAKTIRLGFLYKIDNLWTKIGIVAILGVIVSISIWLLVQYTGIYTPGLSGIIQGIAKIVKLKIEEMGADYVDLSNIIYNVLFWSLYFVINIPLIIFAYFKIGKRFAILSAIYIAVGQLVGFGLGFINDGQGIFIFSKMNPNLITGAFVPNEYINGVQMLPWNTGQGIIVGLFIYATVSSLIFGLVYSAIYILGASTGGTDFIGFYYSKIKSKSIGNLLTTFNLISLVVGATLGSFVCWMLKAQTAEFSSKINLNDPSTILGALFSPNLVASVLGAVISGILYDYYFPRNKVIKVQIYSEKVSEIAMSLNASNWNYKLMLTQPKEDVLLEKQANFSLETICLYIDIPLLISTIRSIDNEGLITIYSTFGFDGELPTSSYER